MQKSLIMDDKRSLDERIVRFLEENQKQGNGTESHERLLKAINSNPASYGIPSGSRIFREVRYNGGSKLQVEGIMDLVALDIQDLFTDVYIAEAKVNQSQGSSSKATAQLHKAFVFVNETFGITPVLIKVYYNGRGRIAHKRINPPGVYDALYQLDT